MSKLAKLINNPKLFAQDVVKKQLGLLPPKPVPTAKSSEPVKKPEAKKPEPKKAPVTPPTLITDLINPFKRYAHVIHTGEGMTHGPAHLSQWIPFFEQSDENYVVVVRNLDLYHWVRETYDFVIVVYAKNPTNIEQLLNNLAFVKGIYYLSNTGNMIHTLRFNAYQHIFLGHGDSDKTASAHKFFRVYDEIWVAGQAHIDRFKHAGFETRHLNFVKVGRPMLANVLKHNEAEWMTRHTPKILYLPTWEGVYEEGNYSSVRISATMLTELHQRFGLSMTAKFHPTTGSRDKMLANVNKLVSTELLKVGANFTVADKLVPVNTLISNANIYICDISAVVSECIAGNAPLFVYIPKDKEIKISQSDMSYEDYAYTFSNIEELCEQLEQVLNGNDFKKEQRLKAMDYLMSVNETKNYEFFEQLKRISSIEPLIDNVREEVFQ